MRIIDVSATNSGCILLGRVGENKAHTIMFNCAHFVSDYGVGIATLTAKLPTGEKYPVSATQDGNVVTWVVAAADVGTAGFGECELTWTVGDVIAKTQIFATRILPTLTGTDTPTPPAPALDWVDRVATAGAQVLAAAQLANTGQSFFEVDSRGHLILHTPEDAEITFELVEGRLRAIYA